MGLQVGGREVNKVAVIGSGQIGPDIALHFVKVLAPVGGDVVVIDIAELALERGKARVEKKIARGEQRGAFKPDHAASMRKKLRFTTDYDEVKGADIVVEAATEDAALKGKIFGLVEARVDASAILLSNSSHIEPERIFAPLQHKGRTAVAHYFFPAERNPVIEIVPGDDTDEDVTDWLLNFYEAIGKVPVRVGSQYGYAVDPIFEGIFEAAALCVQEGLGSVKEVDYIAREALGMTVGPFTAMNLTGGNPITQHGLNEMHDRLGPWFGSPQLLDDQLASGAAWEVCGRGETADVDDDSKTAIIEALRGAYLGLCFGIVDSGIISLDDYELAIEVALDLHGPCALANRLGVTEALRLVQQYADGHGGFIVPKTLETQAASGAPFSPSNLIEEDLLMDNGGIVRLIRIRRPKVLNALDDRTYDQLNAAIDDVKAAPHVIGAVLSGFGHKAFVSGADVNALHRIEDPKDGYAIAKKAQDLSRKIELLGKPVVAAINGLAFGGGLELALGCKARIGVADVKVLCGLPEVNLGIIPAGGGTTRLTQLAGWQRAHVLLRTGRSLSPMDALAHGIVSHVVPRDRLLGTSISLVAHLSRGRMQMPSLSTFPYEPPPEALPDVDIGHRSKAVDGLLCEAIRFAATHSIDEAFEFELRTFEKICGLKDMRIGVDNFVKNGPRARAEFVHA